MIENLPNQMVKGVFRIVFGGCILFIIGSVLIWGCDIIPITG